VPAEVLWLSLRRAYAGAMFERFTQRARQAVVLAHEEARTLKHNWIGTEHLLLGLLREDEGLAARVLQRLDIAVESARVQVVRIVGSGDEVSSGQIPLTPRAKKVLELALREALSLGHNYVGTEHVLLGLVRETDGVAARILLDFEADAEKVRNEVLRMLAGPGAAEFYSQLSDASGAWRPSDHGGRWDVLVDGTGAPLQTLVGELKQRLGRPPDAGDLLVMLASVPDGVGQRALAALGVDADTLARAVDEARGSGARSSLLPAPELLAPLEQARAQKLEAIEEHQFEQAAEFRHRERELLASALEVIEPRQQQFVAQVRARLGLDTP
jgi:hypothetical protein